MGSKPYVFRCLRCQGSFSCRAALRFLHGKSLRSYVYQCFSDCIGNEHKIRMVSASCIWFEDAFLGPKVAVTMRVCDLSKKCTFWGGEWKSWNFKDPHGICILGIGGKWPKVAVTMRVLAFQEHACLYSFDEHHQISTLWTRTKGSYPAGLLCRRHDYILGQHQAWGKHAAFCRVFACSLDVQSESCKMQFCNEQL